MVAIIFGSRFGLAALALSGAAIFYETIRVPSERAEARAGMVAASWKAKAEELQRQATAGHIALVQFNAVLAASKVSTDTMEREIEEYQKRDRACNNAISDDDADWLQRDKPGGTGKR